MRLKTSNLAIEVLGRTLFAGFYATILYPWFSFALANFANYAVGMEMLFLLIIAIFAGNGITCLWQHLENHFFGKMLALLAFVLTDIALVKLAGLPVRLAYAHGLSPFYVGVFLVAIFMIIGFRYERLLGGQVDFMEVFGTWSVVLIVSLLLKNSLHLPLNVSLIFLFFTTGVSLAIFRRFLEARTTGLKNRPTWLLLTLTVIGFIAIFAILLTFGFSAEARELVLAPIIWVFQLFLRLLEYLIYAVMWVIGPIITVIINFVSSLIRKMGVRQEAIEQLAQFNQEVNEVKNQVVSNGNSQVLQIILLVLGCAAVYWIMRRLNSRNEKMESYEEERESLFTPGEFQKDLANLLNSLIERWRSHNKAINVYDGGSYAIKIREIYHRFLLQLRVQVPFKKFYTPNEYLQLVKKQVPGEPAEQLTDIYKKARYGKFVGEEELTKMETSFKNVFTPEGNIKER